MSDDPQLKAELEEQHRFLLSEKMATGAELQHLSYRPTLILGLGGTGYEFLRILKAKIDSQFGDEGEVFKYLLLDTTSAYTAAQLRESGIRFRHIGGFDGDELLESLQRDGREYDWWPPGSAEGRFYIGKRVEDGAGQVRPVGRLGLHWHVQDYWKDLVDLVQESTDAMESRLRTGTSKKAKVYICGSLCGGTGAGTFIDAAYLAKEAFQRSNWDAFMTGVLVLPDIFRRVLQPVRLNCGRANAYAALKELEELYLQSRFEEDYLGGPAKVLVRRAPFDTCYLVDNLNENGMTIGEKSHLFELCAEQLYLEIGTEIGTSGQNAFDNVTATQQRFKGRPTAFSSFAVASLRYPVNEMVAYAAYRLQESVILEHLVGESLDDEKARVEVDRFLDAAQLREHDADDVIDALRRSDEGRQFNPGIDLSILQDTPRGEMASQLTMESVRAEGRLASFLKGMEAAATEILTRAKEELSTVLRGISGDSTVGLRTIRRFREHLSSTLDSFQEEMAREREETATSKADADRAVEQDRRAIDSATSARFSLFRRKEMAAAADAWAASVQRAGRLSVEAKARVLASSIFEGVRKELEEIAENLDRVQGKLQRLARSARHGANLRLNSGSRSRGEYALTESILGRNQMIALFDSCDFEPEEISQLMLREFGPTLEWTQSEEELSTRIYRFVRRFAAESLRFDLVTASEKVGLSPKDLRDKAEATWRRAQVFWSIVLVRDTQVKGNLEELALIGVPEKPLPESWTKAFEGLPFFREDNMAVTGSPYELVISTTKHGVPLYMLAKADNLEYHYKAEREKEEQDNRNNPRPYHLRREWERLRNWRTDHDTEAAARLWVEGLALDRIYPNGTYFYARHASERGDRPDILLGQGRSVCLEAFSRNDQARQEVEAFRNALLLESGRKEYGNHLTAYQERLDSILRDRGIPENRSMLEDEMEIIDSLLVE